MTERLFELITIADLNCAFPCHQRPGQDCKILHVGTKDYRNTGKNCFDRILPSVSRQTFSDEDYRGDTIPGLKFAGLVEQNAVRLRFRMSGCFTNYSHLERKRFQLSANFLHPFDM